MEASRLRAGMIRPLLLVLVGLDVASSISRRAALLNGCGFCLSATAVAEMQQEFTVADLAPMLPDALRRMIEQPSQASRTALTAKTIDPWKLLDSAVDYAAAAEQIIAEQSARIAELEALAQTDSLTDLTNRRGFEQALDNALDMCRRHDETGDGRAAPSLPVGRGAPDRRLSPRRRSRASGRPRRAARRTTGSGARSTGPRCAPRRGPGSRGGPGRSSAGR